MAWIASLLLAFGLGMLWDLIDRARYTKRWAQTQDGIAREYINRGSHNIQGDTNASKHPGH